MPYVPLKRQDLPQTLADSDFPPEARDKFLDIYDSGNISALLPLLSAHRGKILNQIHQQERSLDCLDYLIYQLKKANIAN